MKMIRFAGVLVSSTLLLNGCYTRIATDPDNARDSQSQQSAPSTDTSYESSFRSYDVDPYIYDEYWSRRRFDLGFEYYQPYWHHHRFDPWYYNRPSSSFWFYYDWALRPYPVPYAWYFSPYSYYYPYGSYSSAWWYNPWNPIIIVDAVTPFPVKNIYSNRSSGYRRSGMSNDRYSRSGESAGKSTTTSPLSPAIGGGAASSSGRGASESATTRSSGAGRSRDSGYGRGYQTREQAASPVTNDEVRKSRDTKPPPVATPAPEQRREPRTQTAPEPSTPPAPKDDEVRKTTAPRSSSSVSRQSSNNTSSKPSEQPASSRSSGSQRRERK